MTGMEAWSLIAPIIAAHMQTGREPDYDGLDSLDRAYVLAFGALTEYDRRKKKKDSSRYTFTGTELEEHDRQVIRGWQETAYPMLKKRAEEEARKHTQAVIAAIDARWDERREQFQSGGWDTYFTNAISFFMSISCRVLIEQFGWKPPNAGQHGRHTKIMKYAEALAETVSYIATDSELDIVQYAEQTKELYGLEFGPMQEL